MTGQPIIIRSGDSVSFHPEMIPSTNSLIGTIIQAGRDPESGICRLIIHTTEEDIKALKDLPIYAPALITIERVTEEGK